MRIEKLLPCKSCGEMPTIRYRMPNNWVRCKCGRKSDKVPDGYEQVDPESVMDAIIDWNKKHGRKE